MPEDSPLVQLLKMVQGNPRYRGISPALVKKIGTLEVEKHRSLKEAVKATRSKLHQIGGAYMERMIDYSQWSKVLSGLPHDAGSDLRDFCRRMMALHASTRERLPLLERIFTESLAQVAPVHSILDLACGLNPLALPWMPLERQATYFACDIYDDMVAFINHFLAHTGHPGGAEICDLTQSIPAHQVQVALLLKSIPCLEQLDKDIAPRLLAQIPAEHLLVSFPAHSLGGRKRGMPANYEAHFRQLVTGQSWRVKRFGFPGELAFLVSR
jgi:16S rRNA (guanine(1405)-N(7))-methyltransferase